ncbi:MAG TPA: PilC/PilY family type IV pilus protein [Thermoanaerobaculia bacterium]|nr:PilC/PilY family type IV pilus protein [Thermoanaerobaculia bacterium]
MRTTHPLRNLAFAAGLFALATGLLLTNTQPAWTDDVDLLRFDTGNPYLFIILDTSGSMNLPLNPASGTSLPGDGDAPGSRIYEAKKALYTVFKDVEDVHFGLATYNQDHVRVLSKHWLYVPSEIGDTSSWPLSGYPAATDAMTFGASLGTTTAGACDSPLSLSTQRADINRFSKLGKDLNTATTIWISSSGKIYQVVVTKISGGGPGSTDITIRLTAQEYSRSSGSCTTTGTAKTLDVKMAPGSPFDFLMYDGVVPTVDDEASVGTWSFQDAFADATLGADRPFTGLGWEGNYDSNFDPLPGNDPLEANINNFDPFCLNDSNGNNKCLSLKFPTTRHPQFPSGVPWYPEVDSGDLLTLDWRTSDGNKNEMLRRLSPNLRSQGLSATPDFGIASYFEDLADFPNGGSGSNASLSLRDSGEIPLIAYGNSPLGRAINDFRCWWNGNDDNKCNGTRAYSQGFEALALQFDPEWGCRRPYLLVISDGEDNSTQESPSADVANLNSKAGIKTWAINVGDTSACNPPNTLHSITREGKGECVTASNPADLEAELRKLLGQIREETRAFASAAVPSVQATVEDKIFLTNFTPIDKDTAKGSGAVWDGHIHSFLKPLPLKDGRPDTSIQCSSKPANQQAQCHLWDAGEVLLAQAPGPPTSRPSASDATALGNADLQLGTGFNQRRVFYAQDKSNGTWTDRGRLFAQTVKGTNSDAVRSDLWTGLGISFTSADLTSPTSTPETTANNVIVGTLWEKQADITQVVNGVTTTKTITFELGDIFHSNPLVVGSPANTRFYAENAGTKGLTCAAGDTGYRCFFKKHEKRRKMLVVGSNDGMVHAIDAGQWDGSNSKFDNGTGREVFAFVPRSVMTQVRDHVLSPTTRKWTVDGTLAVADAFIDPVHAGTPDTTKREWRTVMIGGLREGGNGYFALDITQPDKLDSASPDKNVPLPVNSYVPSCTSTSGADKLLVSPSTTDCGRAPFPAVLWELADAALDASGNVVRDSDGKPVLLDEDGVSGQVRYADLGETWSVPNLGRIKLCEGSDCAPGSTDIKDKFVAIFGGGMDPDKVERRGNYLYMVDVETGKVIYKRLLDGSAPTEPAAVDTDQDGYLDRVYIGTTKGYLYRLDLGLDSSGKIPKLEQVQVTGMDDNTYTANRIKAVDSGGSPLWVPKKIFSTGGRPIYYRPSVIFVAKLGRYALSFGTGDREDLWSKTSLEGRFYVFVDETDKLVSLPMLETALQEILVTSPDVTNADYLLGRPEGQRGWFLRLNVDERVITDSFALSGVTFFSSYQPDTCVGTLDPNTNVCTPPQNNAPKLCAKTGRSRIFIVNTTNANSFMVGADGQRTKFFMVSNFVTNPYVEQGPTKNPLSSSPSGPTADDVPASLAKVTEELKKLFPSNCKFTNYRLDIKTISADTGVVFIAPVPVCIVEKNWKEF